MDTKKISRRLVVGGGLAAAGFAGLPSTAFGSSYPQRPVKLVVGFAPGGGTDIFARNAAAFLSERLGQSVIVENRAGANGNLATEYVASSAADGYTLLISTSSSMVAGPHVMPDLSVDTLTDLEHITMCAESPFCIAISAGLGIDTYEEFVARAQAAPGEFVHAAPGLGGVNHIGGELFAMRAGIEMNTAQYRGHGPILADMLANQVHLTILSLGLAEPYVRSGQLKPIVVMARERAAQFPDVPTSYELGIEDLDQVTFWIGLHAPKGTPAEITGRVREALREAYQIPELIERLVATGLAPIGNEPEEFLARMQSDFALYGEIIEAAGITAG